MVNSYQRNQCDLRSRLGAALSTPPHPSHCGPLCASRPLIALGFLKENDHYCQNQTIRPANDVWLRTTTPLPLAYELNEPTGSQNRKSKQKGRRKYVDKHTLQMERGTLLENWHQKCHVRAPLTAALCVPITCYLVYISGKNIQKSGSKQSRGKFFSVNISLTGSLSPTACDFIYLSLPRGAVEPSDLVFELAYIAVPV